MADIPAPKKGSAPRPDLDSPARLWLAEVCKALSEGRARWAPQVTTDPYSEDSQ
jgi:hypothetical protein